MKTDMGLPFKNLTIHPYISIAEEALNGLTEAGVTGAFWVNLFPILKYVPSWFPGASFQKKAARWRDVTNMIAEKPFRHVHEQLVHVHSLRGQRFLLTGLGPNIYR